MKTFSGFRIEIQDAIDSTLQSLIVTGKTTQSGTGDPSPDNVRSLHGVAKITVSSGVTAHDYYLPQPLYSLPDGTRDEYDAVGGLGTQRVGKVVWTGTESWYKAVIDNTNLAGFGIALTSSGNKSILCDKLRPTTVFISAEEIYVNTASQVFVRVMKSRLTGWLESWTDAQKVAAFKAWLSANTVAVVYQLATPQAIVGEPQQISTHYPRTEIINDADADMTAVAPVMDDLVASLPAWRTPKTGWVSGETIEIADWQRIDDNIWRIADFYGMTLPYKTWQHTSWPTPSEVARIKSNINALLDQTHSFQAKFDWNLLNDIELLLLVLHERVLELQFSIRRAGTFVAGQEVYIPIGGVM